MYFPAAAKVILTNEPLLVKTSHLESYIKARKFIFQSFVDELVDDNMDNGRVLCLQLTSTSFYRRDTDTIRFFQEEGTIVGSKSIISLPKLALRPQK
jgi:hypothetical protein